MQKYRRITHEMRCQIYALLKTGLSKSAVARDTGLHKSTIYRELERNSNALGQYHSVPATRRAEARFLACRRHFLIRENVESLVVTFLFQGWSPEQIAGRLRMECKFKVTFQTIYNYLKGRARELLPCLRRYGRRGAGRLLQRSRRFGRVYIDRRPQAANERLRLGDWERDTFYVMGRKPLLACVDRKSRFLRLAKVPILKAPEVTQLTHQLLHSIGKKVHTLTNDNGSEFRETSDMKYPTYFCHPMKPHQRGTIENTIGLLRQYIKRTTDIDELSKEDVEYIETLMNSRPRKCLKFMTPYEVQFNKFVALAS